jgi:integrase
MNNKVSIINNSKEVKQFEPLFIKKEVREIENNSALITQTIIDNQYQLIYSDANLKTTTLNQYEKISNDFTDFLKLNGFNFFILDAYKKDLAVRMEVSNANKHLSMAKHICKQADKFGLIPSQIEMPKNFKTVKEHTKDGLTKNEVLEVQKYIKTIKKDSRRLKVKLMFNLLAFHGLRSDELVNIKIENINFQDNTFFTTQKGQTGLVRKQFLNKEVVLLLNEYISTLTGVNIFLFSSKDGTKPVTTAYIRELFAGNTKTVKGEKKRIKGIFERAGVIGRSVHGLRHFFITHMIESGVSETDIIKFTGHSTTQMISIYRDEWNKNKLVNNIQGIQNADFGI